MKSPAELWVEALRSGKYPQSTLWLHNESGYCCLGVACAVYQEIVGDLDVQYDDLLDHDEFVVHYDEEPEFLPTKVQNWLGLNSNNGGYRRTDWGLAETSLTQLNDGGAPFDEIADIIESRPPGLFKGE